MKLTPARHDLLALALALALASPVAPVVSGQEITGPVTVSEHTLGRLAIDWRGGPSGPVAWLVFGPDGPLDTEPIGDRLIFTGAPGRYTVIAAVVPSGAPRFLTRAIEITEDGDGPSPDPDNLRYLDQARAAAQDAVAAIRDADRRRAVLGAILSESRWVLGAIENGRTWPADEAASLLHNRILAQLGPNMTNEQIWASIKVAGLVSDPHGHTVADVLRAIRSAFPGRQRDEPCVSRDP